MMYLSTVNVIAKAWLLKGCVSSGIWPVFGSTPKTSPVKRGIMQTQSVIRRTAYVQKNMHTFAQSGGSPLFLVADSHASGKPKRGWPAWAQRPLSALQSGESSEWERCRTSVQSYQLPCD